MMEAKAANHMVAKAGNRMMEARAANRMQAKAVNRMQAKAANQMEAKAEGKAVVALAIGRVNRTTCFKRATLDTQPRTILFKLTLR